MRVELSTRPEKSIGTDEQWERAEAALREALERQGREYQLNPGDGAFYGPKIDFHVTDALGRSWQCGTCQLDFFMPERFDLSYTDADDDQQRPVMIHRALLGSMERFAGILIEHYAGRFPVWLAPVQAIVLPVADRHVDYAERVAAELREAGVRVELDERSESVGKKIRDAELGRYPYMLVVGDREAGGRHGRGPLPRRGRAGRDGGRRVRRPGRARRGRPERRPRADRPVSILAAVDCRHTKQPTPLSAPWPRSHPRPLEAPPRSLVPVPRRFDRRPPERDTTRINERIRVPKVRLIGADGEQLGIVETDEALRRAQEADLDLVEVAPNSKPPVTRLLDYSKYKYEQEQKQKAGAQAPAAGQRARDQAAPEDRRPRLRDQEGPRRALPAAAATRSR